MSAAEQPKIDEATAVVKTVAKRRKPRKVSIFAPAMMTQRVYLPMQAIGSNTKQTLENKLARDIISMWSTYTPPKSADPSARTEFQELKPLQTSEIRTLIGNDAAKVNSLTSGSGLSEELRMNLVLAMEYLSQRV